MKNQKGKYAVKWKWYLCASATFRDVIQDHSSEYFLCKHLCVFTFMLPCIVIDFFLNNQPDPLIIPILFYYKTTCFGHLLCPSSGVFYCTFGTGNFHAGFWWPLPSGVRMKLQRATLPLSEPLPTTTTGHYTICCKNLSLTLLKMGKRLPETCWADLGDQ